MEEIEDSEIVASEHDRLVSAISKLDKTQHITAPTRNEPTNLNSEFNLVKRDQKLNIENVVKLLGNTANHVKISKKLKKTQDGSKVLPKPLEKPQAERIKRATGYEETKKKVGRWDAVVARNRTVDYVSFPLKNTSSKLEPTKEFLSKFNSKSPLERELEEVDPPPADEEEEDAEQEFPMTYEEMIEHRHNLAKLRAQQSYRAAKAKRQSKIKSKKYHRILKKEKLKLQLKEFEELQKKDPEEALKKLEALEKARALERHTLRHKNTGKWAKSKLVRAKYDKEVRQELAEQLAVSRGLTHKTQKDESSDDNAEDNEVIPDINLAQDPMNPWMLKRGNKPNVNDEFDFGYKKYIKDKMYKRNNSDSESDEETVKEKDNIEKLKEDVIKPHLKESYEKYNGKTIKKPCASKTKKLVATSSWVVETVTNNNEKHVVSTEDVSTAFESFENNIAAAVEKKLKAIRNNIENLEKRAKPSSKPKKRENEDIDTLEYLKLKKQKLKPIIDEELLETGTKNINDIQNKKNEDTELTKMLKTATQSLPVQSNSDNIDPSQFIEVKPKYLNTALPQDVNEYDQLDDDEQVVPKVNIEDVFEEDDVVASFRQEKEDEINKNNPEDIDLSLPGWGSWGGKGVKAPKRKRNRFILKAPPITPRRDDNKGDIIIKEYKDPKLAVHKVTDVPFPFTSIKEYEASIRAPLGNTFVPEKAHKKLIKPGVFTKSGTIIEPMDEEELLVRRNRTFNNDDIINILAKK